MNKEKIKNINVKYNHLESHILKKATSNKAADEYFKHLN